MTQLKGKTVVITGAAQGIGAALAKGLADAGANIVVSDIIDGEACAASIRKTGGAAIFVQADITDDSSVNSLVKDAQAQFGSVNALVNNAALFGKLLPTAFENIDIDAWDHVMKVNVRGVWQTIRAVTPAIPTEGGSIINIASNRAFHGYPNMLHYDASKGAIVAMTKALASELGKHNIRVNAVCPGFTVTDNVLAKPGFEERHQPIVNARAIKRSQIPDDLVGAIVFLASDASAFMTGQSLVVDGGGVMR